MFLRVHLSSPSEFPLLDFPMVNHEAQINPVLARVYKNLTGKEYTDWQTAFGKRKSIREVVSIATRVEIVFDQKPLVSFDSWDEWLKQSGETQTYLKHIPVWLLDAAKEASNQQDQHLYQFVADAVIEKLARSTGE